MSIPSPPDLVKTYSVDHPAVRNLAYMQSRVADDDYEFIAELWVLAFAISEKGKYCEEAEDLPTHIFDLLEDGDRDLLELGLEDITQALLLVQPIGKLCELNTRFGDFFILSESEIPQEHLKTWDGPDPTSGDESNLELYPIGSVWTPADVEEKIEFVRGMWGRILRFRNASPELIDWLGTDHNGENYEKISDYDAAAQYKLLKSTTGTAIISPITAKYELAALLRAGLANDGFNGSVANLETKLSPPWTKILACAGEDGMNYLDVHTMNIKEVRVRVAAAAKRRFLASLSVHEIKNKARSVDDRKLLFSILNVGQLYPVQGRTSDEIYAQILCFMHYSGMDVEQVVPGLLGGAFLDNPKAPTLADKRPCKLTDKLRESFERDIMPTVVKGPKGPVYFPTYNKDGSIRIFTDVVHPVLPADAVTVLTGGHTMKRTLQVRRVDNSEMGADVSDLMDELREEDMLEDAMDRFNADFESVPAVPAVPVNQSSGVGGGGVGAAAGNKPQLPKSSSNGGKELGFKDRLFARIMNQPKPVAANIVKLNKTADVAIDLIDSMVKKPKKHSDGLLEVSRVASLSMQQVIILVRPAADAQKLFAPRFEDLARMESAAYRVTKLVGKVMNLILVEKFSRGPVDGDEFGEWPAEFVGVKVPRKYFIYLTDAVWEALDEDVKFDIGLYEQCGTILAPCVLRQLTEDAASKKLTAKRISTQSSGELYDSSKKHKQSDNASVKSVKSVKSNASSYKEAKRHSAPAETETAEDKKRKKAAAVPSDDSDESDDSDSSNSSVDSDVAAALEKKKAKKRTKKLLAKKKAKRELPSLVRVDTSDSEAETQVKTSDRLHLDKFGTVLKSYKANDKEALVTASLVLRAVCTPVQLEQMTGNAVVISFYTTPNMIARVDKNVRRQWETDETGNTCHLWDYCLFYMADEIILKAIFFDYDPYNRLRDSSVHLKYFIPRDNSRGSVPPEITSMEMLVKALKGLQEFCFIFYGWFAAFAVLITMLESSGMHGSFNRFSVDYAIHGIQGCLVALNDFVRDSDVLYEPTVYVEKLKALLLAFSKSISWDKYENFKCEYKGHIPSSNLRFDMEAKESSARAPRESRVPPSTSANTSSGTGTAGRRAKRKAAAVERAATAATGQSNGGGSRGGAGGAANSGSNTGGASANSSSNGGGSDLRICVSSMAFHYKLKKLIGAEEVLYTDCDKGDRCLFVHYNKLPANLSKESVRKQCNICVRTPALLKALLEKVAVDPKFSN